MINNYKKLIIFMPSIEGGGVEKNLFIITNFLQSKLKKVSLITVSKKYKSKFKKVKIYSPYFDFWDNCGRRIKYIVSLIILLKILIKNKDVVVFAFQANLYCAFICKLLNTKIIIRSNSSPSGWSKNFLKKILYKKFLTFSDIIIVNSEEFKKEFKKMFDAESTCIYNPLNKQEVIRNSKKKIKFNFFKNTKKHIKIINVARFTDQKDHLTLLRSLNLLKDKIKFKALIIGRGINKIQMDSFINENNLDKQIKLINFQDNPYPFIAKSDLFILSSRYEGLPNVLLEASSLKKAIISTNCPTGPKEILDNGKGGLLFKIGDHKDLSKKIIYYLNNKKIINKKISHSFKMLDRFDYNKNLHKYLNLIKNELTKK